MGNELSTLNKGFFCHGQWTIDNRQWTEWTMDIYYWKSDMDIKYLTLNFWHWTLVIGLIGYLLMDNEQSPYDNGQFCHGKMNNGQWTMDI